MKKFINKVGIIILISTTFSSCVNETWDDPVFDNCVEPGVVKTKEVADVYTLAGTAGTTTVFHHYIDPTDVTLGEVPEYIEAYVISSDEGGNFFKSMYLQPIDGSKGFNVSVDAYNLYSKDFEPGKKVFVKLNGLAYANPTGFARGLILGAPPTEIYAVDRIPTSEYLKFLIPSCKVVNEDDIVKHITLTEAKADTYLNNLVEIDGVQFQSDCGTYDPNRDDESDASINITDNGTNTLTIRTSRYAKFAGKEIPTGRGKIRGVLTKYGTGNAGSTYQIILRSDRDVQFTGTRVDYTLPKIGTAIQYLPTLNENFESYATTTSGASFPKYVNDAYIGSRFWDVKSFSSNKYIQMTSFGASCATSYFSVPVAFTPGSKLSFKTIDGYYKGDVLKVYYTTNYVPGTNTIDQATLVDITSSFNISKGNTTGYASSFTNSGEFVIPASLTGNGFFVFEYSGDSVNTTTIQIDDIKVTP